MILFHSFSRANVGRALVENVWQSSQMPHRLTAGDPVFLNANGENHIHFLGVVDKITEEPLHKWPDAWQNVKDPEKVPTIYLRSSQRGDFGKRQGGFNYKKK